MKTKFFLCMRPTVIETDDGDYIKLPSPVEPSYTAVSRNISTRRNQNFHQRKRVASERFFRQLSVKSNSNTSEGIQIDSQKITRSVSEACIHINFSDEESAKKPSNMNISSDHKVNGGPESNLGAYLIVGSLFFTVFLGKFVGILCTLLMLVCLFCPYRKNNGYDSRRSENVVPNSPEKVLVKECYKKRVIMDGLLERKNHYRENNKLFS